jgi:hypothetical protein
VAFTFSFPALIALDDFILLSTMPDVDVRAVESRVPGKVMTLFQLAQAQAYAILIKRYAIPPPPVDALVKLLVDCTVPQVYQARGWDPTNDKRADQYNEIANAAWARLKEAADGKDGLFELLLPKSSPAQTLVSQGSPLFYAEQNPYSWQDAQANAAREGAASYGDVSNPFGLCPLPAKLGGDGGPL